MSEGLTCFLVDDDEDDREIFSVVLEEVDKTYQCITAINGMDALQKLNADEAFIPDFIFLDLNMPVMSGKQCLQEIKKISRLATVPVVIYTTSSFVKDIEESKQLGAVHFLVKPSNTNYLRRVLSQLFQKQDLPFSLEGKT